MIMKVYNSKKIPEVNESRSPFLNFTAGPNKVEGLFYSNYFLAFHLDVILNVLRRMPLFLCFSIAFQFISKKYTINLDDALEKAFC